MTNKKLSTSIAAGIGGVSADLVAIAISAAVRDKEALDYIKLGRDLYDLLSPTVQASRPTNSISNNHNNTSFGFDSLPPEIRNEVYRLCPTIPGSSLELTYRSGDTEWTKGILRAWMEDADRDIMRSKPTPYLELVVRAADGTRASKWLKGRHITLALLSVSQKTHAETIPILYGYNKFVFKSTPAFEYFSRVCTRGVVLLRDISILAFQSHSYRSPLECLRNAKNVQRLHLVLHTLSKNWDHQSLAREHWAALREFVLCPTVFECKCESEDNHCPCELKARRQRFGAVELLVHGRRHDSKTGKGVMNGVPYDKDTFANLKKNVRTLWKNDKEAPGRCGEEYASGSAKVTCYHYASQNRPTFQAETERRDLMSLIRAPQGHTQLRTRTDRVWRSHGAPLSGSNLALDMFLHFILI